MSNTKKQWLLLILAAIFLFVVITYLRQQMAASDQRPMPPSRQGPTTAANIEVVSAYIGSYKANITAFGSANSRYQITLQAQVGGEITELAPHLETGALVAEGQLLVSLDPRDYEAAVASAQAAVESARVALLEEEREGELAQAEWQAAKLAAEPDSALVFRQPQLQAAKASLREANSNLISAQRDLDDTKVVAPFNALVVERLVSPGSLVQEGTELATLYSSNEVEIQLNLTAMDWGNLPPLITADLNLTATLTAVNGQGQWQARVTRQTQHLDSETRQRALILTVDKPLQQTPPLFPGQFVRAQLTGVAQPGLWRLPITALSQRSEIWYVEADNVLDNFPAEVAFSDLNFIYVKPPQELASTSQQIVVRPLNSYLKGMHVNPMNAEGLSDHE